MSDTRAAALDAIGRNILTVGQLLHLLRNTDPNTHVVVADNDWYRNIAEVVVPGPDWETAEWSCVTLFPGDEFDARQL